MLSWSWTYITSVSWTWLVKCCDTLGGLAILVLFCSNMLLSFEAFLDSPLVPLQNFIEIISLCVLKENQRSCVPRLSQSKYY